MKRKKREELHSISRLLVVLSCLLLYSALVEPALIVKAEEERMPVMLYLYGGSSEQYLQQLERTNGTVNQVLPNYFSIEAGGKIVASIDQKFVSQMHQAGIKVIPFVSNHWNLTNGRAALENWRTTAHQLAQYVLQADLDGINIDIENLRQEDASNQNLFLRELHTLLQPHHKQLSIAVAAATEPSTEGWIGQYDYATIGQLVDYVIIMAYDKHYEGSQPGAIAPLSWVEESITYLATQIPAQKLILGLPFYGRQWTDQEGGTGIGYDAIHNLIAKGGLQPDWDETTASPFLHERLGEQVREIWYENSHSLQTKLQLIENYQLAGMAGWRLGLEDPAFWPLLQQFLSEYAAYFLDTRGHWAERAIIQMAEAGLIQGYPNQQFQPDQAMSREEVVALFHRLAQENSSSNTPKQKIAVSASSYCDVQARDWAYEALIWAEATQLVTGYEDGRFRPKQAVTRAEFATLFNRYQNSWMKQQNHVQMATSLPYPDCEGHWATPAFLMLETQGLIQGFPDGLLHPDQVISRAEVATILARSLIARPE